MKQLLSFRLRFFSGSDFKIQRIWLHNFWLCLKKTGWHDIIQIILSQCMIQQVWKYLPEVRNPILVRNFKRPRNSKTQKLIWCMWKIFICPQKKCKWLYNWKSKRIFEKGNNCQFINFMVLHKLLFRKHMHTYPNNTGLSTSFQRIGCGFQYNGQH